MATPLALSQAVGVTSSPSTAPKSSKQPSAYLPEVDVNNLVVWNSKRRKCCGYLNKKGGSAGSSGGLFSKRRNWQKRFFILEHRIGGSENYLLKYYAKPDDSKPKGVLPLDGAEVLEDFEVSKSKKEKEFMFQLKVPGRKDVFDVQAESQKEKDMWMETLKYVASVASRRGMVMRKSLGQSEDDSGAEKDNRQFFVEEDELPPSPRRLRDQKKVEPSMRLEIDVHSIPPGSNERAQFVATFQEDVARSLFGGNMQGGNIVKVTDVKPAPGMDWLTIVVFDLVVDLGGDESTKQALFSKLDNMVGNPNSELFNGMVTCQTDSTYRGILGRGDDGFDMPATSRPIATQDERVKGVLSRYINILPPETSHDPSKFHVYLKWEGATQTLWVPSPRTLPRKSCVLWPYEIKDCLGISNTVSDVWMTPVSLNPSGVPSELSVPLMFEPSERHGGLPVIDTSLMRQGVTYHVQFDDRRMECLEDLTEEQQAEIEETFQKYDVSGDGVISREECLAAVKGRTDEAKAAVDKQFEAALNSATLDAQRQEIFQQKTVHYRKIEEAESQLLTQLLKADIDGNGELSEQEFYLAEAWWMKSTLNPTKISLF
ncbi:hypothetical protein TL16_g07046 [Triparma laevis f. inornata]|uniref:Calmodulin n=2 Tax=Triparma laevis TaxID=1534972 RepID=A0A9W7A6T3_9STRA|nr:hypothetical protein TrLO_g8096 [Triparma laevis f. longispina]GMH76343.1 hypothetical protein TL16_g07046 [Triparma laevis f. inornata]